MLLGVLQRHQTLFHGMCLLHLESSLWPKPRVLLLSVPWEDSLPAGLCSALHTRLFQQERCKRDKTKLPLEAAALGGVRLRALFKEITKAVLWHLKEKARARSHLPGGVKVL